ncbi:MAG: hypothetical protein Q4F95_01695 [Oscillospiraceae bacterium]|nr:hypothetical protein [Oscillospiraceae bacterium]
MCEEQKKKYIQNKKCITPETILAFISVFVMWGGYYADNRHIFGDSMIFTFIWGIGVVAGLNVCFPAWWIVIKKGEGFAGMGITLKNIGPALIFSAALGAIRFNDLYTASKGIEFKNILPVLIFNLLSIWEVCFLFSWLFTRYKNAFGKWAAALLTVVSVCIYHIGSLPLRQLLTLMAYVFLCALCFAVTENIFTLWPVYWVVGCSASVIRAYGSEEFGWDMTAVMGIVLFIQLAFLFYIFRRQQSRHK